MKNLAFFQAGLQSLGTETKKLNAQYMPAN